MAQPTDEEIIREFVERTSRGVTDGIEIKHRVAGGMPGEQRVSEEVVVSATGLARARSDNAREPVENTAILDRTQTLDLFRKLGERATDLVPRAQARFLPDSLVGTVVIKVDEHEATLFYLADESERETQQQPLPPETAAAVNEFSRLTRRLVSE
ncbi:hypothetical protein ACFWOG_36060 [Kitasatospora sp. NPDC058406]|uniref:hypothetical protein n=1 Tax=Kitasatospora sp. NPDC058406 TaxID=3346483 RepID=UPI00365DE24C